MPRFSVNQRTSNQTENYEGEKAYKLSKDLELYSSVCTASLQPKFYVKDVGEELVRIKSLVKQNSPEFVAKLAVYAREEMYLRSVPLVLAVELGKIHKGDNLVSKVVERVVQRADELYELLAYYQIANEREGEKKLNKLSNQVKLGLANAFSKFDEYQYGKYNRNTEISLRDVMFLVHPKPPRGKKQLYKKIADDKIEVPYTWETQLSQKGNTKEVWEELIDSKKVGYMATLRNLRNIINAKVSKVHMNKVLGYISNKEAVRKSRQLPFRFLSAYRELKEIASFETDLVLEALEIAIIESSSNIPIDDENNVVIACDVSGSMQENISPRSKVQQYDIGLMLGMMLNMKCRRTIVGMFGEDWKTIAVPRDNILRNADEFHNREGEVGYATNGWKVIDWMIRDGIEADKIMMFTDCQMWNSETRLPFLNTYAGYDENLVPLWNQYQKINPKAKLYLFDLSGYGNTPISIHSKNVFFISGWSDKVFNILSAIEKGSSAIKEIESIKL